MNSLDTSERTATSAVLDAETRLAAALTAMLARLDAHATATAPLGDEPPLMLDLDPLDLLGERFGLSTFERAVVLLAAAVEMSASVGLACALGHGDARKPHATFGLALAALPRAHWSAITPDAPLRRRRLVHLHPGEPVTRAPLRIDERILHLLAGIDGDDAELGPFVTVRPAPTTPLPPSLRALVETVVATWSGGAGRPAAHLYGADREHRRAVAGAIARALGARTSMLVDPVALPAPGPDLDAVVARLERESILTGAPIVVEPSATAGADDLHGWFVRSLLDRGTAPVVVASRERMPLDDRVMALGVPLPALAERLDQWRRALDGDRAPADVERVAATYTLAPEAIDAVVAEWRAGGDSLWAICRARGRTDVGGAARVVPPTARWDDLVLPDESARELDALVLEAAHRAVVHERWGFGGRGGGTTALFCGPSGTGKTMAAEVVACALDVDLYHVDLSQVVNKYIGETEKNLARVFDAGERSGAVLLFDEADALFGKRTDIKDSHDRYANIEVSYLLQRMEAYRGVAVLTTNLRSNLDPAFVRRLRFIVQFPHPDPVRRRAIWEHVFPAGVPVGELDTDLLSRLDVSGGTIRNIALAASYRAAAAGRAVEMVDVRSAADDEYRKLDRPLTEIEAGGRQ